MQVPPKQIPQTLGYVHGVARVSGMAAPAHEDRPATARMESDLLLQSQVRPLTARAHSHHHPPNQPQHPQHGSSSVPHPSRPGSAARRELTEPPQRVAGFASGAAAAAALETMHLGRGSQSPAWVAFDGQVLYPEALNPPQP
jgi:hypothetical protein